jgi:hypothetical protein
MRAFLLFTASIALGALAACGSVVVRGDTGKTSSGGGAGNTGGTSGGGGTGNIGSGGGTGSGGTGNTGGTGGQPSGLYLEVNGSGEAPFTAPCLQQTLSGNAPPILPGPAAEFMFGELNGHILSACKTPGANGPRVTIDLGPGSPSGTVSSVQVSYYDGNGRQWAGTGTVTLLLSAACSSPPDGGTVGIATGHYSVPVLEPVVALDAGPSDAGTLSLSGSFRLDLICEDGGS